MAALMRPSLPRRGHLLTLDTVRFFASKPQWKPKPPPKSGNKPGTEGPAFQVTDWSDDPNQSPRAPAKRPGASRPKSQPTGRQATRIRVPAVQKFYHADGTLLTTPENAQFLHETGIEGDHGLLRNLKHPSAQPFKKMGIEVSFSERHTIHPFHLYAFAPRGDPWAARLRAKYRDMLETKPLWVHSIVQAANKPAVVRHTCSRRLASRTYLAAQQLAEEEPPVLVKGTVLILVRDLMRAVHMPAQEFQDMLVQALRAETQGTTSVEEQMRKGKRSAY